MIQIICSDYLEEKGIMYPKSPLKYSCSYFYRIMLKQITSYFKFINEFGLVLFYKKKVRPRIKGMSVNQRDVEASNVVANWVWKNYHYLFEEKLDNANIVSSFGNNTPIWVFWWQGVERMLPLVSVCYDSICKNAPSNHSVILLTKKNYQDYTNIPDFIMKKVEIGEITLTHFSDILRSNLLYLHGGLWLDATMYISRPIKGIIFDSSFFSPVPYYRGHLYHEDKWSVFAMGGKAGCSLYGLLFKFFICYWKEHRILVNYIMIDDVIRMMYKHINEIKTIIDEGGIASDSIFEM